MMISMKIELLNPYVLKILISVRQEDSINSISQRINLSYGWTHKWVQELAKIGVFKLTRMKVYLNKNNDFYKKTLNYVRTVLVKSVQFNYEILSLLGIKYCFTKTDAVFIWTKGGYNISRYKNFYPIFIKIKNKHKELFEYYCKKINLQINKKKGVYYQPIYLEDFEVSFCETIPVDSLSETIKFMQEHIYNFQPALEMIKELYEKKIKIKYKEASDFV